MTSLFGRRRERAAAARAWFYWHSCVYAGATGQGRRRTTTTTGLRERSEMIATDLCLSLSAIAAHPKLFKLLFTKGSTSHVYT